MEAKIGDCCKTPTYDKDQRKKGTEVETYGISEFFFEAQLEDSRAKVT